MNVIKADRYLLNNTTEKSFIWSSSNKDKLINLLNGGETAKLTNEESGNKYVYGNTVIKSTDKISWTYNIHNSVNMNIGINTLDKKNFIGIRVGRFIDSHITCTLTNRVLTLSFNGQISIYNIPDILEFYHFIEDSGINSGFSVSIKRITLNIDSLTIYSNNVGDVILTNNVSSNMVFINNNPLIDFENTGISVKNIYSDNININANTHIIGDTYIKTEDNKNIKINPDNIGEFGQVLSSDGVGGVLWKNSPSSGSLEDLSARVVFLENVIFALTGLKLE